MQLSRSSRPWVMLALMTLLTGAVVAADKPAKDSDKISLFNGKTLDHWKSTDFGGQGEVEAKNGQLILNHGETLTGVTWQGAVPAKMNYEINFDAQRVDGSDFFVGLTFPVNNDCASLICGGWGGSLCGISCIEHNDAANNETTKIKKFENGTWYHIRLRVTPDHIQAWVDDDDIVDVDTKDKKLSVRFEVEASQPLGLASYMSTAAIKNLTLKKLGPDGK